MDHGTIEEIDHELGVGVIKGKDGAMIVFRKNAFHGSEDQFSKLKKNRKVAYAAVETSGFLEATDVTLPGQADPVRELLNDTASKKSSIGTIIKAFKSVNAGLIVREEASAEVQGPANSPVRFAFTPEVFGADAATLDLAKLEGMPVRFRDKKSDVADKRVAWEVRLDWTSGTVTTQNTVLKNGMIDNKISFRIFNVVPDRNDFWKMEEDRAVEYVIASTNKAQYVKLP